MKSNIFIYSIIFILLFSCESENRHYHSFPNSSWNYQDDIKFHITTEDSTQVRISNISIRHNTYYKYKNIIFFLHHSFKENLISTEEIDLLLAEDCGKWIGTGKSNIREIITTLSTPKTYKNGLHSFSLELAMRGKNSPELEELSGITDISFYLTTENED